MKCPADTDRASWRDAMEVADAVGARLLKTRKAGLWRELHFESSRKRGVFVLICRIKPKNASNEIFSCDARDLSTREKKFLLRIV